MSGPGNIAAHLPADDLASAWQNVRGDSAIQYAPVTVPQAAPPPDWLVNALGAIGRFFAPIGEFIARSWWAIWPVLAALVALLIIYLLVRLLAPGLVRGKRMARAEEEQWVPETGAALALLEQADALAAQGRFDEAVHLLLMRSVGQIAEARPDLLEPSSTAREIAVLPALSDRARAAFDTIAQRVERSLFALRSLSAEDWHAARTAYADFALAPKLAQISAA